MGTAAMDTADYYNKTDTKEAIRAIHAALDQGIHLIDPAHSYVWLGSGLENRR